MDNGIKVDVNFRKFQENDISLGLCKDGINEKHPKIIINTTNLHKEKDNISDKTFVATVVTMFHEARHMENHLKQYTFTRDDPEECRQMALSYLVHQESDIYYYSNYYNDPMEIDAEEYGVLMAYNYLKKNFPNADCDKLILDYVNDKSNETEIYFFTLFENERLTNIEDIQKMYDTAFSESKNKAKAYIISDDENSHSLRCSLDKKLIKDECWLVREQIEGTKNNDANKMIASLIIYHHPEYLEKLPTLKCIDFEPTHYFDKETLPESLMRKNTITKIKEKINEFRNTSEEEMDR